MLSPVSGDTEWKLLLSGVFPTRLGEKTESPETLEFESLSRCGGSRRIERFIYLKGLTVCRWARVAACRRARSRAAEIQRRTGKGHASEVKTMGTKQILKELEGDIRHKFKDKNFVYKEDDRLQVCIHRVIDGYVTYISIAEVESLANELGVTKMLELEQSYREEFGDIPKDQQSDKIAKLRLLLYWHFETETRERVQDVER